MENVIFLVVLFIAFIAIATLVLYLILGKKRNENILIKMSKVTDGLNAISRNVNANEKSAATRDNSLRSLVSTNEQKIENVINQSTKYNEGRIGCMEDRIFNEIRSSSSEIQSIVQRSRSDLSESFIGKFSDLGLDLNKLNQNLRVIKEDILSSQAQAFSRMETRISTIRNEEHGFIEHELQIVNREQSSIGKYVQDVTKNMNNHFASLKPLEELLGRLNTLYNNLISLDKDILNQEKSLTGMVAKHTMILEYTKELQKTSEEIFDLMKLMMMDSIVKTNQS